MYSTLKRITASLLLIAVVPLINLTAAQASDDLPRGPRVVSSSVQVAGNVTAIGYTGGFFNRGRETREFSFNGSVSYGERTDAEFLSEAWGCAGSHGFDLQTNVLERRDDGAVRVNVIAWTWGNCDLSGHHGPWRQEFIWVPANASETVEFTVRSGSGATVVSATFTNHWTPRIEDPDFLRPVHWVIEDFRDRLDHLYRVTRLRSLPKSDSAAPDPTPSDTSDEEAPISVASNIDAGQRVVPPVDLPPIESTLPEPVTIDVSDLLNPSVEVPTVTFDLGGLFDG